MPVTKVKHKWDAGNWVLTNSSGTALLTVDGTNNNVTPTLAAASVTAANIAANSLDGTQAGSVADKNVVGGFLVFHRIDVPDAATGNVDTVLTHKERIIDVHIVVTGTVGVNANTIQVFNSTNAVSDALAISGKSSGDIVRAASLNQSNHEIAAGGTLRVTRTRAGGVASAVVYVTAIRVA